MTGRVVCSLAASLLVIFATAAPVLADDFSGGDEFFNDTDFTAANPDENVVLRGSIGIASINARERVYAAATGDDNLSLLLWDSMAPIASVDVKARFGEGWTLRGHFDAAMSGDSNMVDYDWFGPYFVDYQQDNWTHRSISPNTSLDWYLNGDIAVGRDLPINEALTVNFNGGFKYTDVQWTAVGGTYTYSTGGFRDDSGTLPDVPGIRYRMSLPTAFLGLDAEFRDGPLSFATSAKAGFTFMANDTDNHYLRDLLFIDDLSWSSVLSVNARVGYDFSAHLGAFIEASYEKITSGRGDEDVYDTTTGDFLGSFPDSVGGELQVATIKAGLKGNF